MECCEDSKTVALVRAACSLSVKDVNSECAAMTAKT